MGLADRDYMKEASRRTGRVLRLDGSIVDSLRWDVGRDEFVSAPPKAMKGRRARLAAWLALGLGIFTFAWAIGFAIVGAEWAGQGPAFEPPSPPQAAAGAPPHVAR